MPGFSAADSFVGPQNQGNASPSGGLNPQPQSGPEDFSRVMAGYKQLHPDPQANAQLNHLMSLGVDPEMMAKVASQLMGQATAPDPQMPQPPPERPLSVWESIAAAYHPGLLQQFKKDPMANPQFQSQMAAFQQAMIGKRSAQERLTQMLDTAQRTGSAEDIARLRDETTRNQNDVANMLKALGLQIQQQNANTRANPPAKPVGPAKPPKTIYDENGRLMEWNGDGWKPSLDAAGNAVYKTVPANLAGIHQQLTESRRLMRELRENYNAGPNSGFARGIGTAAASTLSQGIGGNLGLSGIAGAIDKNAVIHERDRNAIATSLAFPLTGSRRAIEGARQSLLGIIPHYSDPPEVWDVFERQMEDLINTADQMPWGNKQATDAENGMWINRALGMKAAVDNARAGIAPATRIDPALLERARALAEKKFGKPVVNR